MRGPIWYCGRARLTLRCVVHTRLIFCGDRLPRLCDCVRGMVLFLQRDFWVVHRQTSYRRASWQHHPARPWRPCRFRAAHMPRRRWMGCWCHAWRCRARWLSPWYIRRSTHQRLGRVGASRAPVSPSLSTRHYFLTRVVFGFDVTRRLSQMGLSLCLTCFLASLPRPVTDRPPVTRR